MTGTAQNDREEAVCVINGEGRGGVLLLCEHASCHIPARFEGLGLRPEWRESHAAWDPGALDLSKALAEALDSPLVAGLVSRLVYDCNRPPEAESAMPIRSEVVEVPGNIGLSAQARQDRIDSIYRPFCAAVDGALENGPRALITVHSFTPIYNGAPRTTEIGILHDTDTRLADLMLAHAPDTLRIDRNRPYGPQDGVTHSLKLHAIRHGIPNVMLEVRNDLLTTEADVHRMTEILLSMLTPALAALNPEVPHA